MDELATKTTPGAVDIPLVRATAESLDGLGILFDEPDDVTVEIVRWPAQGWRPVDGDTGDEGGTTEGIFEFWWKNQLLHGRNNAVNDQYIMAADARYPDAFDQDLAAPLPDDDAGREAALLYHANYHPDGGQLFFPLEGQPFVVPLAHPGDDVRLEDFTAYYFDGSQGLYIHPDVWHETMLPLTKTARFFDRQGKVHARVSSNFVEEFGAYLRVPLHTPD